MNLKTYILSLAAIAVIGIGCGGSNSGSCCQGGLNEGTAHSKFKIQSDENGVPKNEKSNDILDSEGTPTGTITPTKTTNSSGGAACNIDPCTLKVLQESHCPSKPIQNPVLRYTKCYGKSALAYAERHASELNYDPTKQMIVYGGAVLLQSDDFDVLDASLFIKGIACGMEVRTESKAGFSNPGHKVFALVKILDKCGNDVKDAQWTKEVTIDENGNFTLELEGLEFGADNQAEVLLFSVKDADITGSTGVTGSF